MKKTQSMVSTTFGLALVGLLVTAGVIGCERKPPMEAKQESPVPKVEAASPESPKSEMATTETAAVLTAPEGSVGRAHNEEGVTHAKEGHWDVAEGHFRSALQANPKLAEAQFNLGVMLDKLGKHDDAKAAFKKAADLAPENTKITESPVLKKHLST
ncbi:MAG: tetratricopeptide repeat protein [Nitrospira sp.]|nr:tetratricopeptide repeat protein [Nitrospira sp.]